ncbi:putative E3 ubiquitin protein ligase [Colletotrichum fructicola Nara gc5]|uniref:HECT-type E3 ubiquitin transferase n=1 Tax=Colletotrichum fructicola (strain Nara gc5) TaxID=1213859 RepID=A0A7J6IJT2_COLFN|nr:putative E3 ubiquitin protein ligase [Colletotrichum fructicola Nara gc5]
MFPTFTGNSRRPRNVNLSGQNLNPFAATSWTPSAGSGASKTVSNAQAERAQRQQDQPGGGFETPGGNHLTLSIRQLQTWPTRADDLQRLFRFSRELSSTNLECLASDRLPPSRLARYVRILVEALEGQTKNESNQHDHAQLLLNLLTQIVGATPESISKSLRQYYTVLADISSASDLDESGLEVISRAVLMPLGAISGNDINPSATYEAFSLSFLARHDLRLVEQHAEVFFRNIDLGRLATAITEVYLDGRINGVSRDQQLWLLAHFIGLHQGSGAKSQGLQHLNALHLQLSSLSADISLRLSVKPAEPNPSTIDSNSADDQLIQPLPLYVTQRLTSLVDRNGISILLAELTNNFGSRSTSQEFESASLLSGYILTLLRCFPENGDEIRMRLFLGDIPSNVGILPTIKFLWQAMSQTSIYRQVLRDSTSVVGLVRNYLSKSMSADVSREQEWRLMLLFLELYTFILRLSDDEDFFSSISPSLLQGSKQPSRLRSCGLSRQEVEDLSIVLKHLAFALHYNAQDIQQGIQNSEPVSMSQLESYFGNSASKTLKDAKSQNAKSTSSDTRLDLGSLRSIVTSALRLLYERDSRRPFLPPNHWLMTSKFDMEGFVSAVVAEQERQNEMSDSSDDEDGEIDEDANIGGSFIHTVAGQRVSRHAQIEKLRSQQRKAQRDRLLAVIGPKLEILRHMPFVIPFDTRVQIFRQMMMMHNPLRSPGRSPAGRHHGKIRRGQVFRDAFEQFYELGEGLKEPIQIQFVDQFDTIEAGIDGGGVTKEFLTSVTTEAFSKMEGISLFTANSQGLLYPNPTAMDELKEVMRRAGYPEYSADWQDQVQDLLRQFEFLGRIVGKCMYEGILIDIAFAGFFLLKWTSGQTGENSYRGNVNDLRDLDEELYQGMLHLKNLTSNVADLALDFTITDQVSLPGEPVRTVSRNLIPNGENVPVTNDNRLLYISYVARHRLVAQPAQQTAAFLRGLRSIIAPSWLSMFNQNEIQRLVGGDSSEIDIDDLRQNTIYSGLYEVGDDGLEHPTVQLFWKVMAGFSDKERRDVLKYVTSTPRAPLLGFSQLSPRFSIRDGGEDQERLPSTSTCVNLLKLPRYKDEETLRKKLLYAVSSGAGFDLS